ncbi:PaaI family thioesterase [Microbacterium pumilum]|uniref:PaaI family thioesterase n=1 Tax=Microbacterium pumilum TaxID=344165 RepID=A0ABN2SIS4_9MICO
MATDDDLARSRTFSWDDPVPPLAASRQLDGLTYLRALISGDFPPPPIAQLMNFWMISAEPGVAVFECEPGEYHYNPLGLIHGGLACTLLDTVVGCAAHTTLPAGVGYTSIDLNVSYVRPILATTGLLRARGRVVKGGQRVIFASGELTDAAGALLATATSSLLVLRG